MTTAALTALLVLEHTYKTAGHHLCRLVEENYYSRESIEFRQFVRWCPRAVDHQDFLLSKQANILRFNRRLSLIRTSHLAVYDPNENKIMWESQRLETGIRSRVIDAHLVIFQILQKSPAETAGFRVGDEISEINGKAQAGAQEAESTSGVFQILRAGKSLAIKVQAQVFTEDRAPSLIDLGNRRGLLRIPSFLAVFFDESDWRKIAMNLKNFRQIVIDIRGNPGGSFPAMLRVLSEFRCDQPTIGKVFVAHKNAAHHEVDFLDRLDVESQLAQLADAESVRLRGFKATSCFQGKVAVLIDAGSASVSEIFAQGLMARARTWIVGQPTSGQVVMAKWFPIPELGSDDYLVSIPIAGYLTADGQTLEDRGVEPKVMLNYDLKRELKGRNSWVEDALQILDQSGLSLHLSHYESSPSA